jgi:carbonic anhydrase/acetyltransferase-like protein (isoleucine patch superfamily)
MISSSTENIRPNPRGDWPQIDPTAYVDPTAQIIGLVQVGPRVFIGPNAVIRADEVDNHSQVKPIVLEADCNVQDAVIIHALAGTSVTIGSRTSVTHGSILHGPCTLGQQCFVGFGATLYNVTAGNDVFVGTRAIVQNVDLPAKTFVPPGASAICQEQIAELGLTGDCEMEFMKKIVQANLKLTEGYLTIEQTKRALACD